MAREVAGYREQLENVLTAYPDKEMLSVSDAAEYLGICRQTAIKRLPFVKTRGGAPFITRVALARWLCG